MAEGYIGETVCSTYIRQRLHYITTKTASGHTVRTELQMRRTNSYGGATFQYPSNSYIVINGNREDWGWTQNNYPQIPAYNTDWITFAVKEIHVDHLDAVTIGIAGGNYNMGAYLNGDTSGDISLESLVVAPNTPTVSGANIDAYSNQLTFGTSSFGNPNSGTVYLYGGKADNPTTQVASKTTTGNSTITLDNLEPNTTYYYRARAKNSNAWSAYSSVITIKTKSATYAPYPNDPEASNVAKPVKALYVPYNGLAKKVIKLYESRNGKARRIF